MSKPCVFIIESLEFEDEELDRFEGKFISHILDLSGIESKYFYIRTRKELRNVLEIFEEIDYRYLHLSCHGNNRSLGTTLDTISYTSFAEIAGPYLRNRRLFLSACSATNMYLAKPLISKHNCYSIIGPTKDIHFDEAAIMWASFYHLVFKNAPSSLNRASIRPAILKIVKAFDIEFTYFHQSKMKSGYGSPMVVGTNYS